MKKTGIIDAIMSLIHGAYQETNPVYHRVCKALFKLSYKELDALHCLVMSQSRGDKQLCKT